MARKFSEGCFSAPAMLLTNVGKRLTIKRHNYQMKRGGLTMAFGNSTLIAAKLSVVSHFLKHAIFITRNDSTFICSFAFFSLIQGAT